MQNPTRTTDDARAAFQTCRSADPKDQIEFYNSWGENYEIDHDLMNYRARDLAVSTLVETFSGDPAEALVLDVACGPGCMAKLMADQGFQKFKGVDGSKVMLELADKTGLYQDLKLALLGPEPLPAQTGSFDVVILVGGLGVGFIPVSIVRELCNAAKPGGLICMAKGDHTGSPEEEYSKDLERELQQMVEEGLWSPENIRRVERYMTNPHVDVKKDWKGECEEPHINGTVYIYKKSII